MHHIFRTGRKVATLREERERESVLIRAAIPSTSQIEHE